MARNAEVFLAGVCLPTISRWRALGSCDALADGRTLRGSRQRLCPWTAFHGPGMAGFYLAVDCLDPYCRGERNLAVGASFYKGRTVGEVLRRMRCSGNCRERVLAAWLETGPIRSAGIRPRRVPFLGPEARE